MKNFMTLYQYELKKIIRRKLVWITLLICLLCIAITISSDLYGTYYVDGKAVDTHYHMFQVDKEYRKALSGRIIAQELLEEMTAAYGKIPETSERYTLTDEYQTYARPYSEIFGLVWDWTQENPFYGGWIADEKNLYAARTEQLEGKWQALFLSDAEKEFWREKERQLDTPFVYFYHEGYLMALKEIETVGILMLLFTAICLSGVFTEEHIRRTDQMILSSAKGKSSVYWAKILAGISASMSCAVVMAVVTVGGALSLYGADGFQMSVQIYFTTCSYPITIGQACLIVYGIFLLTAVFVSVLVMVVSEILHSSIATLALSAGIIVAGQMFRIPNQYRIAAQIWQSLPMCFLSNSSVFSSWLTVIGNHYFTAWQSVPVIYIICGIAAAVIGKRFYREYQVSGR